ncbi:MAG: hypothetical protein WKF43_00150 [Acidimicrobiales bacterium]
MARPMLATAIGRVEDRLARSGLGPGHRGYRRFVIVTRARTGSNLLVSLLNSHPQIDARGELLGELKGETVEARLGRIFGRKPRRVRAVGFKVFYYHPLDDPAAPVWVRLRAIADLHVVHLKRRNVLRTLTSRKLAGSTNVWLDRGRPGSVVDKPVVRFSAHELERAFTQNEAWEAACDRDFRDQRRLELTYEDLVSGPALLDEVTAFLGVDAQPLRTTLHRQNPEPLSALIADFDELRQKFRRTRWSAFFDEP